eukprot:scaffold99876_cov17-Tisochrysis_lutea.AAC.1
MMWTDISCKSKKKIPQGCHTMGARVLQHVCCQQCNENLLQVSMATWDMVLAASVSQPDKVHTSSNVTCILSCPWKTRARCPHVHKMDSLNSWM